MIDLTGMVSIPYLKKSCFPGSYQGMRYLLEKRDEALWAVIWPEPYSFAATEDDKKHQKEFTFDPEGFAQAVAWLNEEHQAGNY
ncbi:MAG: hypothetical protein ACRDBO_21710 [Lachnospiraceae bacterium]